MERVYGTVIGPMGLEDPETDTIQPMCHFRQLNIGDWLIWADMGGKFSTQISEFNPCFQPTPLAMTHHWMMMG
jgi:hypothetical protein